jgi:hypothetical protein
VIADGVVTSTITITLKDGTNNPVTMTRSGRIEAAWHPDYNEGNWNDGDFRLARGEFADGWRSGW